MNRITIMGNLGGDPEIRRLENGTPVGKFNVATSENYRDANGEWQKTEPEWHEIVVWRQLAEQAEKTLKKGAAVFVEGKMNYRKYTDKNGIERRSAEIVANTLRSLEMMPKRETSFPSQEPPQRQYTAATSNVAENSSHRAAENTVELEIVAPPLNDENMVNGMDLPF